MNKKIDNEKLTFLAFENRDSIDKLAKELKKIYGIESRVDSAGYLNALYVDINDYQQALIMGSFFAKRGIEWVDINNNSHPIGYIPILYAVLPQTQKGNKSWTEYNKEDSGCPTDIKDYMNDLKEYCGVSDLLLKYNKFDNAFSILAKSPFYSHELMIKRCFGFNCVNDNFPFIEIFFPSIDNSIVVDSKKEIKERTSNLMSYFYNSLFYEICRFPRGANIAPHNDEYPMYMGSYGDTAKLSEDRIEVLPDDKLMIIGSFKLDDYKGDEFVRKNLCVVTDSGKYKSELSLSQDRVSITTTVYVSREVLGKDIDGQNLRDTFFTCLSGTGSRGTITYTEHFVKIANGTRLLHYSDEYDKFEIFNLPNNWFIENGLFKEKTGFPKVSNCDNFEKEDKEVLEEVYEILNSRDKNHSKQKLLQK